MTMHTLPAALESLAAELDARGHVVRYADRRTKRDIVWRGAGGNVHVARARFYGPDDDGIVRFCVDYYRTQVASTTRAALGLPAPGHYTSRWFNPSDGAEQTCHLSEVRVFAAWLAAAIDAHELGAPLPPPTCPTQHAPDWHYQWTDLAAEVNSECVRARAALRRPRPMWGVA